MNVKGAEKTAQERTRIFIHTYYSIIDAPIAAP